MPAIVGDRISCQQAPHYRCNRNVSYPQQQVNVIRIKVRAVCSRYSNMGPGPADSHAGSHFCYKIVVTQEIKGGSLCRFVISVRGTGPGLMGFVTNALTMLTNWGYATGPSAYTIKVCLVRITIMKGGDRMR